MFPTRFPTGESGTVLCVIPSHMFFHCLNFSTSRPGAFSLFSQFASLVLKNFSFLELETFASDRQEESHLIASSVVAQTSG
jgi:hypothetical protein